MSSHELGCEPEDDTQVLCSQIRDGMLTQPHLPPSPYVRHPAHLRIARSRIPHRLALESSRGSGSYRDWVRC